MVAIKNQVRQLTVISGKGGTGKTTLTAAFATLAQNKVVADCDVDAPDLYLVLTPQVRRQEKFYGGRLPLLDREQCMECGICEEVCRFEAIKDLTIDPVSCEGCGLCALACPYEAIRMVDHLAGHWFISDTRAGPLVHAKLGVAEENSGKLVTVVRQQAKLIAEEDGFELVLIDGPPGIGCPVIAAITGVNLVLVVTEPTLSGIHDLERVLGVADHFHIPALVCINKYDINPQNTEAIEDFCCARGLEEVGRIPYDPQVNQALLQAKSVIEYPCGEVTGEVRHIWERVEEILRR